MFLPTCRSFIGRGASHLLIHFPHLLLVTSRSLHLNHRHGQCRFQHRSQVPNSVCSVSLQAFKLVGLSMKPSAHRPAKSAFIPLPSAFTIRNRSTNSFAPCVSFCPSDRRRQIPTTSHVSFQKFTRKCRRVQMAETPNIDDNTEKADMDIIERVYTMIFGKKEKEPFGLKRFDRDRFPELYPATLDEFADILPSDTTEIAIFRPLLARTQLQSRDLQLLYDANRDGYSSETFHEKVNRKGACVVLARTKKAVFGGYNPKGFVGYGESRGSKAAFLFTWPDGDTSKPAEKMRKVGGVALAVVDQPDTGPKFGADSLVIPLRPPGAEERERDRIAYSKLGSYYERRPDGRNCLFGDGENGKGELLTDLKVYAGVYADGEEIPFNDALPFSLE